MSSEMQSDMPEKGKLLARLEAAGFNVPAFIYLTPEDFREARFEALEAFLDKHCDGYKVIARSAHADEEQFKSGTFDSFGIYADVGGIQYARKKMIRMARTTKRLSIKRQQHFYHAPEVDLEQMGVIVMPFIEGTGIMAKMIGPQWEFGYCRDRSRKIQKGPYITQIPHDRRLLQLSKKIQAELGFRCEIEYIVSSQGIYRSYRPRTFPMWRRLTRKRVNAACGLTASGGSASAETIVNALCM